MSLSVARQLLGRVLNDRQGDAEKNTPETEWRRQRDLQVRLGVIGKALALMIDSVEENLSSTEESEEIEEELRKLLLTIDPNGEITNYNSGPGSGNPGVPGSAGGGARVTLSMIRLLGNVFVRSKDDEGVLELLRGSLHHVGSRLDGLGRDVQTLAASPGGATDHGALTGLADDDHTQYTLVDGTRAFTGPQSMGSNQLTSLASGTLSTDAVNKGQMDTADLLNILKSLLTTKGDIIAASAASTPVRVGVGANLTVLSGNTGAAAGVSYRSIATVLAALISAKGTIAVGDGTASAAALSVGANNTVLMADSAAAEGVKWAAQSLIDHGSLGGLLDDDHTQYPLKSILTTKGDIYAASAASTPVRLGVGANDTIPVADSTATPGISYKTLGLALTALLTTAGDIAYKDSSASVVRLPVGSNTHVLTVDTALPGKLKWAAAGAGSFVMTVVEVDLGSTPRYGGSFTFTIASSTLGNPILIQQANLAYTGKGDRTDEAEMDVVSVSAAVSDVTTATAVWNCSPKSGPVSGNFKFAYAVSG